MSHPQPPHAPAPISNTSFLEAAAGKKPSRDPVWIMRQAGRYLAEYRRVRHLFPSFLDFCRSPEHVAEVTVQPVNLVGVDAAILFSDILVLLPPMGLNLEFIEGKGPVVHNPVRDLKTIADMPAGNLNAELRYVYEGIRITKHELAGTVPLIGFAGGPFTVASYMVEGGSSKELARLKALMFTEPKAFDQLLGKLAEVTAHYLIEQAHHGCDALTLMDSWAGYLAPEDYRERVMPHTRAVIAAVKKACPKIPFIHYANGAPTLLDSFTQLGADVVGLDWRMELPKAFAAHPKQIFQGNLDPCWLYAPIPQLVEKVKAIKSMVGSRPHIYNLGHGILPDISPDHARAFVQAVHGENFATD
jgi:uroporphyrinogen decarboxylase